MCHCLGGGSQGTYYYSDHGGIPVVTSASVTVTLADMDKVSKLAHYTGFVICLMCLLGFTAQ